MQALSVAMIRLTCANGLGLARDQPYSHTPERVPRQYPLESHRVRTLLWQLAQINFLSGQSILTSLHFMQLGLPQVEDIRICSVYIAADEEQSYVKRQCPPKQEQRPGYRISVWTFQSYKFRCYELATTPRASSYLVFHVRDCILTKHRSRLHP